MFPILAKQATKTLSFLDKKKYFTNVRNRIGVTVFELIGTETVICEFQLKSLGAGIGRIIYAIPSPSFRNKTSGRWMHF